MPLLRVVLRYLALCLRPIPSHLDWIGRLQTAVALLFLFGITQAHKVEALGDVAGHVPGGTPAIILGTLFLLAVNAGVRLVAESESVHQPLNLYVTTGGLGSVTPPVAGTKEHCIYMVTDVFIVNRGMKRVLLRLRMAVPHVPATVDYLGDGNEEIIYANGPCIRTQKDFSVILASEVGDVPHLPTDINLEHHEHVRGHTEFDLDLYFMKSNFGERFQTGPARLEVQDVLSGQVKVVDTDTWAFFPVE